MKFDRVREVSRSRVAIFRTDVQEAKFFILAQDEDDLEVIQLFREYITYKKVQLPTTIEFATDDEENRICDMIASHYSKALAFVEAVNELISYNIYMPNNQSVSCINTSLSISSKGYSSSISFNQYNVLVPRGMIKSYSYRNEVHIFDADIYISNLNISNAHTEVKEAISESILCFQAKLYQPSIVMLGKAIEGAWIELGIALMKYDKSNPQMSNKFIEDLKGYDGINKKIKKIAQTYENRPVYGDIYKKTGITSKHLTETMIWSDVVRESRNAIHFDIEQVIPNSYEKVATILLSAPKHLKSIYRIIEYSQITE